MLLTKESENNLVDFLASFSVLTKCATPSQLDVILGQLPTKCLKAANRFLKTQSTFSNSIPRNDSTYDRGNG